MDRSYWNEEWKEYQEEDWKANHKFLISNYGRVKSFKNNPEGSLIKGSLINGYKTIDGITVEGKRAVRYLHKLVAFLFLTKGDDKVQVIHLDFNKVNNIINNLKWVTKEEQFEHHLKNPNVLQHKGKIVNAKLSESEVRIIKRRIFDPKRKTRLKMIAKQHGISEMQLWRIKSGENWGHVIYEEKQ